MKSAELGTATERLAAAGTADTFPWLDGVRGLAAMWVLLSHVQILSGTRWIPVLSWGGLAVDLFMMLSGMLMAHHYVLRQSDEPWSEPRTWLTFWTRRFFRIAPLYYVLLAVALAGSAYMGQARDAVAAAWPETATSASRYASSDLSNLVAHVTFVFGAMPQYAFRTPLPDWSIGLEMQFYLVFPLLMLLVRRAGSLPAGIVLAVACALMQSQFQAFFHAFAMPSFLPMKLYVFFIGIWIAVGRAGGSMRPAFWVSVLVTSAVAVHAGTTEASGRVVLVVAMFYLMSNGSLPAPAALARGVDAVRTLFSSAPCRLLGDTSYGLYLIHLLVLIPVAGALAQVPLYVSAPSAVRFTLCVVTVVPTSLLLAWLAHRRIELPGIRLGRYVVAKYLPRGGRKLAVPTPAVK